MICWRLVRTFCFCILEFFSVSILCLMFFVMEKNAFSHPEAMLLVVLCWGQTRLNTFFVYKIVYNGKECLLPCNVAGCVVVRTDKTEYMVMQVRGWGQELVILLPGKIIQMQYSATYLFLLKVQKIGRHFVLTDGTNYYIGGYWKVSISISVSSALHTNVPNFPMVCSFLFFSCHVCVYGSLEKKWQISAELRVLQFDALANYLGRAQRFSA